MPCIPWLALLAVCAVIWTPVRPDWVAAPEMLAFLSLAARLLGGRNGLLFMLPATLSLACTADVLADRLAGELHGRDFLVTGQVCSFPVQEDGVSRFEFFTNAAQRPPGVPRRLRLVSYDRALAPAAGEYWQLKVRLRAPRGWRNPAGYDAERGALITGIGARGYVRESTLNRAIAPLAHRCRAMNLRTSLARGIEKAIPDERVAAFVIALTVGARHRLSEADWVLLRRTGTVHLMAISGLHIGLVAGFGLAFGRAVSRLAAAVGLHLPRTASGSIGAVSAATVYAILAGFAVPTFRALLMVLVAALAASFRRRCTGLALLGSALYVVLLGQPIAPLSAGFWLSFSAVMLLLLPGLGDGCCVRPTARLRRLIGAQLRITAGLAPLGIFLFDQQSLSAPLANLIAIPLVGGIVVPISLVGSGSQCAPGNKENCSISVIATSNTVAAHSSTAGPAPATSRALP
ncbi:MAG: ComEC/Rec2 family competence protein, partial [Gammaproteobacteria bacterium]|nr:ComEC/Rec2 family competence protein [Gammaproteobacteria bacterium]